jgi:gluconolactonase
MGLSSLFRTACCLLLLPAWATCQSLDDIVPADAQVTLLAGGFNFTEGPAVDASGLLYFTDLGRGRVHTLDDEGAVSIFRDDSAGRANGLFFDTKNRLHACEGGTGRVTRTEADGSRTVLAEQFDNTRFNSPNDLVLDGRGGLYFTDPFFGRSVDQPQPVQGVYHLAADGQVSLAISDMNRPNGIILSADGKTLFVADDGASRIRSYDIQEDGSIGNGRDFAVMEGISDGLALDAKGNLYAAGGLRTPASQGVWIFSPQGTHIGIIAMPEMPTNCTFANNTLYITAGTSVYAMDLLVQGASSTAVQDSSWGTVKEEQR